MKKRVSVFMLFSLLLVLSTTASADQLTMQEGPNIELDVTPGPNSTITISAIDTNTDEKVKVSGSDTGDFLENQIVGGTGVTVNSDGSQITISAPPVNVEDSADGVEITFAGEGDYDTGTAVVPALDLNGTGLVVGGTNPDVTVGGITSTVLASSSNPQQVIVRVPQRLNAGNYKLKVKNANGFSEGLIPLQQTFFDGSTWSEATASAAWSERFWHTSLAYDNKMWVMGGFDGTNYKNDVWYSTDGITWTQATASAGWSARYTLTSLVFDNKMWVLGGSNGTIRFNDVWYSTDGITWTQATSSAGWSARSGHASVVFDDGSGEKMWVMGGDQVIGSCNGSGNRLCRDVWHSTDGATWTQATASAGFERRTFHGSVVFDNKMWVLGGADYPARKNDVWYSTNGITWTEATSAADWSARLVPASVVYNNKIWVMSGESKNDVWSSKDGLTWSQATASAPWSSRSHPKSIVFDNKIWIMGGRDDVNIIYKGDVWHTSN